MENYIVRIYSRDSDDPCKVTGTLESIEGETRQSFFSLHALPALLNPATTLRPRVPDTGESAAER